MPSILLSDNGVSSGSAGLKSTAASDGALALQTTTAGGTATTAVTIDTSQNVTFTNAANLPNTFGFKNRIINGAMVIDQRNAGASIANTGNPYSVDRWQAVGNQSAKYTIQQSSTAPTGFTKSLAVTSSSAYSVLAGDFFYLRQQIEGYNVADFNLGTANAATFTLSFWVRSSLTGTFGGTFSNGNSDSIYPFTYTISSANTWEQKTITVTGRTSGTWDTTNGSGLYVLFALGTGSTYSGTANAWTSSLALGVTGQTSVVGTNGATFYITGVQLEKGSTATSFDYRPYGTELALCQRYFFLAQSAVGRWNTTTSTYCGLTLPVAMRTTPSVAVQGSPIQENYAGGNATITGVSIANSSVGYNGLLISTTFSAVSGSPVGGYSTPMYVTSLTAGIACSSEL